MRLHGVSLSLLRRKRLAAVIEDERDGEKDGEENGEEHRWEQMEPRHYALRAGVHVRGHR